jgi:hypothetical protein
LGDVEVGEAGLDDFLGEVGGPGKVVEIGAAVVLQPEKVEMGFVARDQLGVGELSPAAGRILFRVRGLPSPVHPPRW